MNINEYLFGPLDKNWCLYFYFLSILWYIAFLVSVFSLISYLFTKKIDSKVVIALIMYSLTVLVMYFEKRILHGMCINSTPSIPSTPPSVTKPLL
jgi:hypothetical protein